MFERHSEPLLPRAAFVLRFIRHAALAFGIVFGALGIGVIGYHKFGHLSWIDALVNAAMILGGMGPVDILHNNASKVFAAFYALFSGLVFIAGAGVLFAPVIHRLLHHFHLELESEEENNRTS